MNRSHKYQVIEVELARVRFDNSQPRKKKPSEAYVEVLTRSVDDLGILHPPCAIALAEPKGFYQVKCGFLRTQIANALRHETIRLTILPDGLTDAQILRIGVSENSVRDPMSMFDLADAIDQLTRLEKCSQTEAAKALGIRQSVASKLVTAANCLAPDVKARWSETKLGLSFAYPLAKVRDPKRQMELLQRCLSEKWRREELEAAIKSGGKSSPKKRIAWSTQGGGSIRIDLPSHATYDSVEEDLKRSFDEVKRIRKQGIPFNLLDAVLTHSQVDSNGNQEKR